MMPAIIKSIWDNGGETVDQYTVVFHDRTPFLGEYEALTCSSNPTHPLGVSTFCTACEGAHLGRQVEWQELPTKLREHVIARMRLNLEGVENDMVYK